MHIPAGCIGRVSRSYLNELRVSVKRIIPGGAADDAVVVAVNDILVSVNGRTLETSTAAQAAAAIAVAPRPLTLVFRRPSDFQALLKPSEKNAAQGSIDAIQRADDPVRTQVAPAAKSQAAQIVSVTKTKKPEVCTVGARKGDLLEVSSGSLFLS